MCRYASQVTQKLDAHKFYSGGIEMKTEHLKMPFVHTTQYTAYLDYCAYRVCHAKSSMSL